MDERTQAVALVFKNILEHGPTTVIDMALRHLTRKADVAIVVEAVLMRDYAKWVETLPVHESEDPWDTNVMSIIRRDVLAEMSLMTAEGLRTLFTPPMPFEELFLV
jgi:hypothetical protein